MFLLYICLGNCLEPFELFSVCVRVNLPKNLIRHFKAGASLEKLVFKYFVHYLYLSFNEK